MAIVSTSLIDSASPKVFTEKLRQWFIERGFTEKERFGGCQILFRDRCTTPLGTQAVIEFALPLDEDEIEELYIRFLLTEQTPEQISQWRELAADLGHDFGFQIRTVRLYVEQG